jgi:hypothetical protein
MKLYSPLLTAAIPFLIIFLSACQKETKELSFTESEAKAGRAKATPERGFAENDMVLYWNEKTATVLGAAMPQPFRARYFAMIQIAVHDALNNIKPKYERYALKDRTQHADPDAAVASAAYWAIKGLGRQGTFAVDVWYNESLSTIPDGVSKELGIALGKQSADAIIANRKEDGLTQVILSSPLPANGTEPGQYRSTLGYAVVNGVTILRQIPNRMVANWGTVVKPFVLESNQQFRPAGPYALNTAEYTADFNEVKAKGARVNATRTAVEDKMAYYWSESRPSILWNEFARKALEHKKLDAWKTARFFALMHVSIAESVNTALASGYHFYSWRPESAIRLAATDGNNATVEDANWLPFITEIPNAQITPPVPGYPNGFAAFGSTTAETLRLFFGSDETSIDLTTTNPFIPAPRPAFHFSSYSQAARENALAIIYTGWDFRKSVLDGEEMGKRIASYVFTHHFRPE